MVHWGLTQSLALVRQHTGAKRDTSSFHHSQGKMRSAPETDFQPFSCILRQKGASMFQLFRDAGDAEAKALALAITQTAMHVSFDPEGRVLGASDRFLQATGFTAADLIGKSLRGVLAPGSTLPFEDEKSSQILAGGQAVVASCLLVSRAGGPLALTGDVVPVRTANGQTTRYLWLVQDRTHVCAELRAAQGYQKAISRSQSVIEFDANGTILHANETFLKTMGYDLAAIRGRHHSMFVPAALAASQDYARFWQDLAAGAFIAGEFCRISRSGEKVWLQASYNPISDESGRTVKVVKFALDTTAQKRAAFDAQGKIAAADRAQAMVEFDVDGRILTANRNFLTLTGYDLAEVVGRHHRMFLRPVDANSSDYARFWQNLRDGEVQSAEFCRLAKGEHEIWLQASYNPVFDSDGKLWKIVKFATDVTARKRGGQDLEAALNKLAEGDLTVRIDKTLDGELDHVRRDLNNAVARLAQVLGEVASNALSIRNETNGISRSVNELSSRTEHQAATLQQTSTALHAMTDATALTTRRTTEASEFAAAARRDADRSSEVVTEAIEAMTQIADSSAKISKIIKVIDEIAFQTNLLALNAGVEAARAGDFGRGFAVVAAEVRALAHRSSEAAREISGLIVQAGEQVKNGVSLVNRAGASIDSIQKAIRDIDQEMSGIAEFSRDQSRALTEINQSVARLDQVTQRNAAMSEETAAATEELSRAADILCASTSEFRLESRRAEVRRVA